MTSRRFPPRVLVPALALALGLFAPAGAGAGPVDFFFPTGEAEQDINTRRLPGSAVIVPDNIANGSKANDVGQAQFMFERGWLSGWNFKDIRLAYDPSDDTLGVAVNFWNAGDTIELRSDQIFTLARSAIAGDVDGNGDPGVADLATTIRGGIDAPDLSRGESITLAFDTNSDGTPDIVAGVPATKAANVSGISAFTVAQYEIPSPSNPRGIERSYGTTLPQFVGALAQNPSQARPDFEFIIENFSDLPNLTSRIDPNTGLSEFVFDLRAYAGTQEDSVSGEDLYFGQVILQQIPEPATVAMWGAAGAIALGWLRVRSGRRRDAD